MFAPWNSVVRSITALEVAGGCSGTPLNAPPLFASRAAQEHPHRVAEPVRKIMTVVPRSDKLV